MDGPSLGGFVSSVREHLKDDQMAGTGFGAPKGRPEASFDYWPAGVVGGPNGGLPMPPFPNGGFGTLVLAFSPLSAPS
jgi:hypothetical protein